MNMMEVLEESSCSQQFFVKPPLESSSSITRTDDKKNCNKKLQDATGAEKTSELDTSTLLKQTSRRVVFNVGGTKFETYVDTCTKLGTATLLGAMLLSLHNDIKDEYFIDRDPEIFRSVLQWYRTGTLFAPPGIPREVMALELDFYGIPREELKGVQKIFNLSAKKLWSCKCGTNIANHKHLTSKGFKCNSGEGFLFEYTVNVYEGEVKKQNLLSGSHLVADIFCIKCSVYLGWKYHHAFDEKNKYKEGKFVLEKASLVKEKGV